MYNSELAELFLQFREKDKILVGRVAEVVLLAFAVQIKLSISTHPCLSWEGPAVLEDCDDRIGSSLCGCPVESMWCCAPTESVYLGSIRE